MNNHADSRRSPTPEEIISLLDEKSLSDIESDAGRAEIETRFSSRKWLSTAVLCAASPRFITWQSTALRLGFFLLPSFAQSYLARDPRLRSGDQSPGPTAYLDGVRGVAALAVFFCHYFYTCFVVAQGWGYGDANYHVLKLPIVRLFYQGPPMVCVFFVVSGYALSLRPLRLMRVGGPDGLDAFAATMASFVFRRAIRLFVPTAASTLAVVAMLRLGLYEWTRDFARDPAFMRNVHETHPERLAAGAGAQLADWARAMFAFVHVWGWESFGGSTAYDVHLWTIPVEFRCSMVLFLTLVGTARLRTGARLVVLAMVMAFTYRSDRWEMLLFYAGMLLAELDVIRGAHSSSSSPSQTSLLASLSLPLLSPGAGRVSPRAKSLFWIALSIVALYLMSQPDQGSEATPGWVFLSSLIPSWWTDKYRYWQSAGAVLFVLCAGRSAFWCSVFASPPARYLGRISYGLYLVHGPILHTVGYAVERWAWTVTGADGGWYVAGFALAAVMVVPLVLWVADVFWRAVDAPAVKFAKWLEGRCSVAG